MSDRNKAVVARFLDEAVVAGNAELVDELCHPDVINHAAAEPNKRGIEALRKVVGFSKRAQPDQKWTWKAVLADGDLVVAYGVREATWQAPQFRGLTTPQGRQVAVELAHLFRLVDGKIIEHWAVRDDLGLMQQLGVVAAPPVAPQVSPAPSRG
jgi:predicted ester cyclase